MSVRPQGPDSSRPKDIFYYYPARTGEKPYVHYTKVRKAHYAEIGTKEILKRKLPVYVRGAEWVWKHRREFYWYYKYLRGVGYSVNYALQKIQDETFPASTVDQVQSPTFSKYRTGFYHGKYAKHNPCRCSSPRCRKLCYFLKKRYARSRQNRRYRFKRRQNYFRHWFQRRY